MNISNKAGNSPEDQKNKIAAKSSPSQPGNINSTIRLSVITVLLAIAVFFAISSNSLSSIFRLLFLLFAVVLAIKLIIAIFKGPARIKYLVGFAIFIIATAIFVNAIDYTESTPLSGNLALIQDNMAEIAEIKMVGNDLVASKKNAISSAAFKTQVEDRLAVASQKLNSLNIPEQDKFFDYKQAVEQWQAEISAATTADAWNALYDEPQPFAVSLSTVQAQDALKASIHQVAALKGFGDAAIARKDTVTMRYIAAKLLAQEYWLEGIDSSPNSGFFNFSLANQAQAKTLSSSLSPKMHQWPSPPWNKNVCRGDFCVAPVKKAIYGTYQAILATTYGQPDAAQQWSDAWQNFDQIAQDANTTLLSGAGATRQDAHPLSPQEQTFISNCSATGGAIVPMGSVDLRRVPTSEGGDICKRTQGGGACWDYLTYSGGEYMGGSPTCPEMNLIPQNPPIPASAPAVAPPAEKQYTTPDCARGTHQEGTTCVADTPSNGSPTLNLNCGLDQVTICQRKGFQSRACLDALDAFCKCGGYKGAVNYGDGGPPECY